jgi:hypothetical protein
LQILAESTCESLRIVDCSTIWKLKLPDGPDTTAAAAYALPIWAVARPQLRALEWVVDLIAHAAILAARRHTATPQPLIVADGERIEDRIGDADDEGSKAGALAYAAAVARAFDRGQRQYPLIVDRKRERRCFRCPDGRDSGGNLYQEREQRDKRTSGNAKQVQANVKAAYAVDEDFGRLVLLTAATGARFSQLVICFMDAKLIDAHRITAEPEPARPASAQHSPD